MTKSSMVICGRSVGWAGGDGRLRSCCRRKRTARGCIGEASRCVVGSGGWLPRKSRRRTACRSGSIERAWRRQQDRVRGWRRSERTAAGVSADFSCGSRRRGSCELCSFSMAIIVSARDACRRAERPGLSAPSLCSWLAARPSRMAVELAVAQWRFADRRRGQAVPTPGR